MRLYHAFNPDLFLYITCTLDNAISASIQPLTCDVGGKILQNCGSQDSPVLVFGKKLGPNCVKISLLAYTLGWPDSSALSIAQTTSLSSASPSGTISSSLSTPEMSIAAIAANPTSFYIRGSGAGALWDGKYVYSDNGPVGFTDSLSDAGLFKLDSIGHLSPDNNFLPQYALDAYSTIYLFPITSVNAYSLPFTVCTLGSIISVGIQPLSCTFDNRNPAKNVLQDCILSYKWSTLVVGIDVLEDCFEFPLFAYHVPMPASSAVWSPQTTSLSSALPSWTPTSSITTETSTAAVDTV